MATTRRATPADLPFMVHVLRHAAGGTSGPLDVEECRANPAIAHYIDGWTPDQVGLICLVDDTPVGAAWVRNLPASDPGYGFVARLEAFVVVSWPWCAWSVHILRL